MKLFALYLTILTFAALKPNITNGFINRSSSVNIAAAAMPLRSRAAVQNHDENTPDHIPPKLLRLRIGSSQEKARAALKSLQYCYKICIMSVIADVIVVLIDDEIFSKIFGASSLVWTDAIDIIDTTNVLVFARGLGMLSRLYQRLIDNPDQHMTDEVAMKVFRTMAIVWTSAMLTLGAVAIVNASALPTHAVGGPFGTFFETITPSKCIYLVMGFLGIANVLIRLYCRHAIAKERTGINIDIFKAITEVPVYRSAEHAIGHRAYLSQALCMGSFAALAILDLVKWIISDSSTIGRLFSVSDVITPFALTALLFELNRSFLRTALFGKARDGNTSETEVRNSLFAAQSGFYDNVAEIIKGVTIVRLLPYVAAPIKPYAMDIANQYAPPWLVDKLSSLA